jgi:YD repeat-containing protein
MVRKRLPRIFSDLLHIILTISMVAMPLSPIAARAMLNTGVSTADNPSSENPGQPPFSPAAVSVPPPFTLPNEPVYLVNGAQIGRTLNFGNPYPNWQNITPASNFNGSAINDFVLDPFDPYNRALVTTNSALQQGQAGGVWITTDLADDKPVWTQTLNFSQIAADYANVGQAGGNCFMVGIGRIVASPEVAGSYVLTVTSDDAGNYPRACPQIIYTSSNGGQNWNARFVHPASTACFNYDCSFGGEGGVGFGAGNQVAVIEAHGAGDGDRPYWDVSSDGGQTWPITFLSPTLNSNYPFWDKVSQGMYASRQTSGAGVLLTSTIGGCCDYHQLWTTSSAWGQVNTVLLSANNNSYTPIVSLHTLSGFLASDGTDHTYVTATNDTDPYGIPNLFRSLDMGNTWSLQGALPAAGWTSYAVNPQNEQYRLSATTSGASGTSCQVAPPPSATPTLAVTPTASAPSPTPSLTATPPPLACPSIVQVTTDGQVWADRTGDWLTSAQFGQGWTGGHMVVVAAPSFVQIHRPIDPDAVAGDGSSPTDYNTPNLSQGPPAGTINPRTGNFVYPNTDLTVQGPANLLAFHRVYSGQHNAWKDNARLGPGWFDNYNVRLIFADPTAANDPNYEGKAGYVIFQEENGSRQKFIDQGNGTYAPELGLLATLQRNGTAPNYTYTVTLKKQINYQFDTLGRLTQIDQVSKLGTVWKPITLTYDTSVAKGALLCVIDGLLTNGAVGQNQPYIGYSYYTSGITAGHIKEVFDFRRGNPAYCTGGTNTPTNPNSSSLTLNYDAAGYLTSATDLNRQTWTYTYDPTQQPRPKTGEYLRMTQITDPEHKVLIAQHYDSFFRIDSQRNGKNDLIFGLHYQYPDSTHSTPDGNPSTNITDALNNPPQVDKYDVNGNYAGVIDTADNVQSYQFHDQNYRLTQDQDQVGNLTVYNWSSNGQKLTSIKYPSGNVQQYDYDTSAGDYNFVTGITSPSASGKTSFTPDPTFATLPGTVTDPLGNTTTFKYDPVTGDLRGIVYGGGSPGNTARFIQNTQSSTSPVCNNEAVHFDGPAASPTQMIENCVTGKYDPAAPWQDITTQYQYDNQGRRVAALVLGDQMHLGNRCTLWQYNSENLVTKEIVNYYRDNNSRDNSDCLNDPAAATHPNYAVSYSADYPDHNITTVTTYTPDNKHQMTVTDVLGHVTTLDYDTHTWQIVKVSTTSGVLGQAKVISYVYDTAGNQTQVIDGAGRITLSCYDENHRQVRTVQNATQDIIAQACQVPAGGWNNALLSARYRPSKTVLTDTNQDQNVITDVLLNGVGDVIQQLNPKGVTTLIERDTKNLKIKVTRNPTAAGPTPKDAPDQNAITILHYFDDPSGRIQYVSQRVPSKPGDTQVYYNTTVMCYNDNKQLTREVVNDTYLLDSSLNGYPDAHVDGKYADICSGQSDKYFSQTVTHSAPDQNLVTNYVYDSHGRQVYMAHLLDRDTTPGKEALLWDITYTEYKDTVSKWAARQTKGQYWIDPTTSVGFFNAQPPLRAIPGTLVPTTVNQTISYDYDGEGRLQTQLVAGQRTTFYEHDALDRVISQVENYKLGAPANGDTNLTTHTMYDGLGRVLSITTPGQRTTRTMYDDNADLMIVTDPLGHTTQTHYDPLGNIDYVIDKLGNITHFTYDGLNRQTTATTPEGLTTKVYYDLMGHVLDQLDANQASMTGRMHSTHYVYDSLGRLSAVYKNCVVPTPDSTTCTGSTGSTYNDENVATHYTYDVAGNLIAVSPPVGNPITLAYDLANRQVSTTVNTSVWSNTYDAGGRVRTSVDPNHTTVKMQYEGSGRVQTVQYAPTTFTVGNMVVTPAAVPDVVYNYDALGRMTTFTDGRLKPTAYSYDGMDRLNSVTDPNQNVVSYDYDPDGNLAHLQTSPVGKPAQQFTYDYYATNQVKSISGTNGTTTYNYDLAGRLIDLVLPNGIDRHYGYDRDNRLQTLTYKHADQITLQYDYSNMDAVGNWKTVTENLWAGAASPVNSTPTTTASAPTATSTTPVGTTLTPTGSTTPATVAPNLITFASRQNGGNWQIYMQLSDLSLKQMTNEQGGALSPAWSPDGTHLAYMAYRNGHWNICVMNADKTNVVDISSVGADDSSPTWSPDGKQIAFISKRDGHDHVYVMNADGSGSPQQLTFGTYDDAFPAWSPDGKQIAFSSFQTGHWELYTYQFSDKTTHPLTNDAATDTTPTWSPDGKQIAFVASTLNQAQIAVMNSDGTGRKILLIDAAHTDLHPSWSTQPISGTPRIAFRSNRNGLYQIYSIKPDGSDLQQVTTSGADNDHPAWSPTPTVVNGLTSRQITYTYDSLYRVWQADYVQGALKWTDSYTFDKLNRQTVSTQLPNQAAVSTTLHYNENNQVDHISQGASSLQFNFDLAGNLIKDSNDPAPNYAYDAANRLVSYTSQNASISYKYDGKGSRYEQTANNVTTDYVLGGIDVMGQVTSDGHTTLYQPGIGQQRDGQWAYFGHDALGSVRQLTDASGNVTYGQDFDPYGNATTTLDPTRTTLGYKGAQNEANGLLYMDGFYYNPTTAMSTNFNPLQGFGRATTDLGDAMFPISPVTTNGSCSQTGTEIIAQHWGDAVGAAQAISYWTPILLDAIGNHFDQATRLTSDALANSIEGSFASFHAMIAENPYLLAAPELIPIVSGAKQGIQMVQTAVKAYQNRDCLTLRKMAMGGFTGAATSILLAPISEGFSAALSNVAGAIAEQIGLTTSAEITVEEVTAANLVAETAADAQPPFVSQPEDPAFVSQGSPSTGYTYMSRDNPKVQMIMDNGEIPENQAGTYISRDKYDVPAEAVDKLQLPTKDIDHPIMGHLLVDYPNTADIRVEYDTDQLTDMRVPDGLHQTSGIPEPFAKDYPQWGNGGGSQFITNQSIKVTRMVDLRTGEILFPRPLP